MSIKFLQYLKPVLLGLFILLSACGADTDNGPLPSNITINADTEYTLHDEGAFYVLYVDKDSEFNLDINAASNPSHPDIQLTYNWSKLVYEKSFSELLAENGNNVQAVLYSLEGETDFKEGDSITEMADWELTSTGYVQYSVKIGAEGYHMEYIPMTSTNLSSSASRNHIFIRVYFNE